MKAGDVLAMLGRRASEGATRPAFRDHAESLDYAALARRVAGAAEMLEGLPTRLGLLGASSIDWLVTDLAAWATGKELVSLPHFFSDAQLAHIVADAGLGTVIAADDQMSRARGLAGQLVPMPRAEAQWRPVDMRGMRMVYTSGSSGAPKGVRLGADQMRQSCTALLEASGATKEDRHLSVLPYALLLEAICGIYLPILAGGNCVISADIIQSPPSEIGVALGEAAARAQPTTSVLVPQLLQAWTIMASVSRVDVPDSLRFVAVGGAAVPDVIADRAWAVGIPVYEGYGLTECCSVVAVNRPGARRPGTVGKPLSGCDLRIADDGEIIVRSATVAQGYLGRDDGPANSEWHTGDLGSIDDDGYLRVAGRKDNLIVTANGRNVTPEWVETMLLADPRISRCVIFPSSAGNLALLIEPSQLGVAWFAKADEAHIAGLIAGLTASAPDYARPHRVAVMPPDGFAAAGLLTANGRPRRRDISARNEELFANRKFTVMEMQHGIF